MSKEKKINDEAVKSFNQEINEIKNQSLILLGISEKFENETGTLDDVIDFEKKYNSTVKNIESISKRINEYDYCGKIEELLESLDSEMYDVQYIFDKTETYINILLARKQIETDEVAKKKQGIELAVFSIVLSNLAFILTNVKVLSAEAIDLKGVLLTNFSFILAADIFFSLIFLFLGPVFYSSKGKLRWFTFVIFPIILLMAIVLIELFL